MEGMRERKPSLKPINTRRTTVQGNDNCVIVDGVTGEEPPQPLSPWSKGFHQPDFNIHILAIMGSKTPIDASNAEKFATQFMHLHPRFTSALAGDPSKGEELIWVRVKKVDLDHHIVVPPIDPGITPGSKMADKYVEDYIYNLSKTSFDTSRPLWDLHILQLKTTTGEGIGIFRSHHSLGDGISLMSFLLSCTRKVSDPAALPTIPMSKKKVQVKSTTVGRVWSFCNRFWKILMLLWWVLVLSWNSSVDILMFFGTCFFLKDTDTPFRGKSRASLRPRRNVYTTVNLDDFKLIKNTLNATINDVALGITQAGLSVYLDRKYNNGYRTDEGTSTKKKNKLPNNIRLRSLILVNMRPSPGIQELPKMMEKNSKAKWGNSLGYLLLPFNIRLQDDPLDYVREAKARVDRKKHSLETVISFLSVKLLPILFGDKVANAMSQKLTANTTIAFSNVAGPLEEIMFCGHPIKSLAATCYGQPQPLMIFFTSYVNEMTLAVSVDEDTICDPQQLCDDIVESLELIKEACKTHAY